MTDYIQYLIDHSPLAPEMVKSAQQQLDDMYTTIKNLGEDCDELGTDNKQLKGAAVLSFRVVEEVAFEEMSPAVTALDHYLANELNDTLWDEINTKLQVTK